MTGLIFIPLAIPTLMLGLLLLASGSARSRDVAGVLGKALIDLTAAVFAAGVMLMVLDLSFSPRETWPAVMYGAAMFAGVVSLASLPRVKPLAGAVASGAAGATMALMTLAREAISQGEGVPLVALGAGIAGLLAAMNVGPRVGKYNRDGSANVVLGHALIFQFLGVLLVAVSVAMSQSHLMHVGAWTTAILAACGATLASAIGAYVAFDRSDLQTLPLGFALGLLVGVFFGPGNWHTPVLSIVLAMILGGVLPLAVARLDTRWRVDEPGGLVVLFIFSGLAGLIRLFTMPPTQAASLWVLAAVGLSVISVVLVYKLAGRRKMLRIEPAVETEGSDLRVHDLNAYPDFTQPMIRSYHLRQ